MNTPTHPHRPGIFLKMSALLISFLLCLPAGADDIPSGKDSSK